MIKTKTDNVNILYIISYGFWANIGVNPARGRMGVGRETDAEGNWNTWAAERQEQSGGRPN